MTERLNFTKGELLEDTARRFPKNDAVVYPDRGLRYNYREFNAVCDRVAKGLMALGIEKGEHVAIWATNVPEWLILDFATGKMGAVLVTVNTLYKTRELEYILNQSDATTLVLIRGFRDTDYVETLYEAAPRIKELPFGTAGNENLPFLKRAIFIGDETPEGMMNFRDLEKLGDQVADADYQARKDSLDQHEVINMQYTSGTTGFPKGVQLTHFNIANDGFWIGACQNLSAVDRVCIPVPLFHCFGCVLGVMACVNHGATMVMLERFDAVTMMMSIEKERCTAAYGVPTMYIAILDHPLFNKFNYSSLRTGLMSGSPCPEIRMRQVVDLMNATEISIPYGLTESGPVMTQTRYFEKDMRNKCKTIGQALPGIEVAIIDPESGEICEIGKPGEICCRGFNTMKGYYKMSGQTAACIDAKGWLHSGDIGHMDAEGYYFITGRLKDLIIRGGENISPKEVEDFIGHMEGVQDVQLIGVPSKKYGEQPGAFIIRKPGAEIREEDVTDYCRNKIAWFKIPKYVRFVDAYPQTASGKIQKYLLREEAARLWPDA